jgi:hypothetical protein
MNTRNRILITLALLTGALLASLALTTLSRGTDGPLTSTLSRTGAAVASIEHRLWQRVSGGGRAATMAWFDATGRNADALRHPDRVLLGVYDGAMPASLDGAVQLERALGAPLPLMQIYSAWGDKPEQQFPVGSVTAIWDLGSVPVITWEPWLTDFDNRHSGIALTATREQHGLSAVAAGDYDFYIDAWAREAAAFGKPIFVRFAHEMNDAYRYPWGPQNNSKEEYIAAWRHVVERFRTNGATNVLWVWAPHVAYQYWETYYPGADVVDWVGTGVLNFGPIARWSQWWSFDEIFGRHYRTLAAFGKPIMIPELGSLAVGGDRARWYTQALDSLPIRYPAVKSVMFFHTSGDRTVTYQAVDWTLTNDSTTLNAVKRAVARWPTVKVP